MIAAPPYWSGELAVDRVELVHPEGRDVAVIEYRERARPLLKLGALLHELAEPRPELAWTGPDRIERVITDEGEYGAVVILKARELGRDVQLDVGFVFGDDFYARVAAVCRRAELRADLTRTVRQLVVSDVHALGVRRRRFEYTPPAGWQPIMRGYQTDWLAPEYPREQQWLTAYPAMPISLVPAGLVASLVGGDPAEVSSVRLANGLSGHIAEATFARGGDPVTEVACVLHDARYVYAFDATAVAGNFDRHRGELEAVFASVEPIPSPRTHEAAVASYAAQSYWAE